MTRSEIAEHAGYLRDATKLDAYRRALRELVRPGTSVLDLGAGTGLLGVLAAEAGARVVYAVDRGPILGAATEVARANGYGDRYVPVRGRSTDITLPERVDLAVCDQIGGLAYDAGVLEYFRDARTRLLAPDGVLVPGSFTLAVAPVTTPSWAELVGVWSARPGELDLSPMVQHAANTEYRLDLGPEAFLAEPRAIAERPADDDGPIRGTAEFTVAHPGELHGVGGVFTARLSPSVTLTNCPLWPSAFDRWRTFYPVVSPVRVAEGDAVRIDMDVRPRAYLATWTVAVRPAAGGLPQRRRGSTALGTFLTPQDLAVERGGAVPAVSPTVDADRYALELVDGARTVDEIVAAVLDRYRDAYRTDGDGRRRVRGLLARHVRNSAPCAT